MSAKKRSRAAAAARMPKAKSRKTADHGKVPSPSNAGGTGVSSGPSAAWLRMQDKAKQRAERDRANEPTAANGQGRQAEAGGRPLSAHRHPRKVPGQETLFAEPDDTLHPLQDVFRRTAHEAMNCPYCIAPDYIQQTGWPSPCRCRITENVECASTASAEEIGHHYSCPYWDHTDGLPF